MLVLEHVCICFGTFIGKATFNIPEITTVHRSVFYCMLCGEQINIHSSPTDLHIMTLVPSSSRFVTTSISTRNVSPLKLSWKKSHSFWNSAACSVNFWGKLYLGKMQCLWATFEAVFELACCDNWPEVFRLPPFRTGTPPIAWFLGWKTSKLKNCVNLINFEANCI